MCLFETAWNFLSLQNTLFEYFCSCLLKKICISGRVVFQFCFQCNCLQEVVGKKTCISHLPLNCRLQIFTSQTLTCGESTKQLRSFCSTFSSSVQASFSNLLFLFQASSVLSMSIPFRESLSPTHCGWSYLQAPKEPFYQLIRFLHQFIFPRLSYLFLNNTTSKTTVPSRLSFLQTAGPVPVPNINEDSHLDSWFPVSNHMRAYSLSKTKNKFQALNPILEKNIFIKHRLSTGYTQTIF